MNAYLHLCLRDENQECAVAGLRYRFAAVLLTINGWRMIGHLLRTFWFGVILAVWGFILAGPLISPGSTGGALPWWILGP